MSFERLSDGTLDYAPCQYGRSKLTFRGPKAELGEPYLAFLGGTMVFGKFVERPYPVLVAQRLGIETLNLGCVNAGVDAFHEDSSIIELCRGAQVCVVQIMGAHELSNRFYSVHPRRNDRIIAASERLLDLFPEADLSDVHFARHLLQKLQRIDENRFLPVVDELRFAWVARMKSLIRKVEVPVVLLWVSERAPDQPADDLSAPDPLLVTREMLDDVCRLDCELVEIVSPFRDGRPEFGVYLSRIERQAARVLPGPDLHRRIAAELPPAISRLI